MTRSRLRRWHFDLALLLGIVLFAFSYWLHGPHPRWESRISTDPAVKIHMSAIGFSPDEHSYYTLKDDYFIGSHKPQPLIQRWDVKTGELVLEYPLQLPAEALTQSKLLPVGVEDYCVYPLLVPGTNFIEVIQSVDRQAGLVLYRLFDVTTGECCTKNPPTVLQSQLKYLMQNPKNGHHWGCFIPTSKPAEPAQLYDLTEGIVLTTFQPPAGCSWYTAEVLWDQGKLVMIWVSTPKDDGMRQTLLTIHRLNTWECLQQITLPVQPAGIHKIVQVGTDQFEVKYFQNRLETIFEATARYRFNPQSHEYEPVLPVTSELAQGNRMNWYHNQVYIHRDTIRQAHKPHQLLLTISNYLERIGITLAHYRNEEQISIYDAKTGSLLRKLTGLPEFSGSPQQLTISTEHLANLEPVDGRYRLTLYHLPHYLWQPTLSVLIYFSWLLIIAWPFRYVIRRDRLVRTHPAPP